VLLAGQVTKLSVEEVLFPREKKVVQQILQESVLPACIVVPLTLSYKETGSDTYCD
jgi:hypothetical protein